MSAIPPRSFETAGTAPALARATARAGFGDYLELTKPRLSFLSVLTAAVGYLAALPTWHMTRLFIMLAGTAMAAGGVAALNQWMEADVDAQMRRTRDRPIPTGKVATGSAFVIGWGLCAGGLGLLYACVNGLAAFFALATIVCYLALYTPAKRWSRWSTEIGAVAGALPPLIGWAAATGHITGLGWILFGVLFFWQLPHFMAIAWIYRADYAAVHFPMLSVRDASGGRVAAWTLINTVLLVAVTLLPVELGYCGVAYGVAAAALGAWFVWRAVRLVPAGSRETAARRLFFVSICYLPLLLGALVIDRVLFF